MPSQPTATSASALVPSANVRPTEPLREFDLRASLAKLDARLRHRLREHAMQVAAMRDVVSGSVALLEIGKRKAIVDLARTPVAPGQPDRLGRDGMQLVGEADRVKEFYRIGADVDPGAELGEFRRLLVDLHLESLPAQRDGCRQPAQAPLRQWQSDARFPLQCSGHGTLLRREHRTGSNAHFNRG